MYQLMTSGTIGNMVLKNRIIMTAVHTGFPIDKETAFLERRAAGGAAAVTAVMGISKKGASVNMCVLEPDRMDDLKRMAEAVHRWSGNLLIQLFHAGRNAAPGLLADPSAYPVGPSPIPSPIYKTVPKELDQDEIREIVSEFGKAAVLCRDSGVNGVEISCSAGYLLSEFLSPLTNQRTDEYGGSPENRMKFPLEVIKEVRRSVGDEYPVILRVSAGDMLGGYGILDTVSLIQDAERYIDAVNVTGGWHESGVPQISMHVPEGGFAYLAREIKKYVRIPVIACNRINNGEIAAEIIESGYADFVGCARAFLADSNFVNKINEGIPYRRCIGCNKGCIEKVLKMQEATCIFNPETGRESVPIVKREPARKTLIIGGGPAGIEAALQCAKRGDKVKLCTDEKMVGGLLHAAAKAPFKGGIARNIKAMRAELEKNRVDVRCGVFIDPAFIDEEAPDFVVVATGSEPVFPPISGLKQSQSVYTAQQILTNGELADMVLKEGTVLILGGGSVGLETALFLAKKMKLSESSNCFLEVFAPDDIKESLTCQSGITVVEMSERMGSDLGGLRRFMLHELNRYHVDLLTGARVEEILENKVVIRIGEELGARDANTVILAAGYKPRGGALPEWLAERGKYPYCVIGDAAGVGNIGKALREAWEACR